MEERERVSRGARRHREVVSGGVDGLPESPYRLVAIGRRHEDDASASVGQLVGAAGVGLRDRSLVGHAHPRQPGLPGILDAVSVAVDEHQPLARRVGRLRQYLRPRRQHHAGDEHGCAGERTESRGHRVAIVGEMETGARPKPRARSVAV